MRRCLKCKKDISDKRQDAKFCCRNCKNDVRKRKYKIHRKESCEFCGFIPVHICQLDIDHKDGNRNNNAIENLITLCANCHRLKTHLNNENKNYYK